MKKILAAKREYSEWCRAIGITNLADLAKIIQAGEAISLINLCEARQERKYAEAADQIFWNRKKCRIVMMSGPSSSGKTSSSLRIAQQARVLGLNPKVIELDNYSWTGTKPLVMPRAIMTSRPWRLWTWLSSTSSWAPF